MMSLIGARHTPPAPTPPTYLVGSIHYYPADSVPTGFLMCDGSSILVADFIALHAVIGYAYGGSGLNFNLPNYAGQFLRFFDATSVLEPAADAAARTDRGDATTGNAVGTKQASQFLSHTHTIWFGNLAPGPGSLWSFPTANTISGKVLNQTDGSPNANETRPININLMAVIKT